MNIVYATCDSWKEAKWIRFARIHTYAWQLKQIGSSPRCHDLDLHVYTINNKVTLARAFCVADTLNRGAIYSFPFYICFGIHWMKQKWRKMEANVPLWMPLCVHLCDWALYNILVYVQYAKVDHKRKSKFHLAQDHVHLWRETISSFQALLHPTTCHEYSPPIEALVPTYFEICGKNWNENTKWFRLPWMTFDMQMERINS